MIELRLFATFRQGREKIQFLDSSNFKTAQDILDSQQINIEDVAILLINGYHKNPEHPVNDNDIIALFPPVGGG